MLGTLQTIYNRVEPKSQDDESIRSAKAELTCELAGNSFITESYLSILLSQLKYWKQNNMLYYIMEIRDMLNFLGESFNIEDPSEIFNS